MAHQPRLRAHDTTTSGRPTAQARPRALAQRAPAGDWGRFATLSVCCLLAVSCVEAEYGSPPDAKVPGSSPRPDASLEDPRDAKAPTQSPRDDAEAPVLDAAPGLAPVDPPIDPPADPPAWSANLRGDYMVRARIAGLLVGSAKVLEETLTTVHIEYEPASGEVVWTAQLCRDQTTLPNIATGAIQDPLRSYKERRLLVKFSQGMFRTEAGDPPQTIGFSAEPPADCVPGQKHASSLEQAWLTDGQCDCPTNTKVPSSKSDCRVLDPDGDKQPGIALKYSGGLQSVDHIVTLDNSQIIQGDIASSGRHRAKYAVDAETIQLQCPEGTCFVVDLAACPAKANDVLFAPLKERTDGKLWPCADAMELFNKGELFTDGPQQFPSTGC